MTATPSDDFPVVLDEDLPEGFDPDDLGDAHDDPADQEPTK